MESIIVSAIPAIRKAAALLALAALSLVMAGCAPVGGPGGGPIGEARTARVALLVPGGSGNASDEILATSLINAARLAIDDLSGVTIDLAVYQTGARPDEARASALRAIDEGAEIILGPVFAQEANAAGVAVAGSNVNVLAFSNNPDIAGANVFILGPTFDNTARRLAGYAVRQGKSRIMIAHEQNTAGELGARAIRNGVAATGGIVVGTASYEFSQSGVALAAPEIAAQAKRDGADALFLTADSAGALPLLSQFLVDNGVDPRSTRFLGLTRWDVPAETLGLPSLQGGWFTLPDPTLNAQFSARYQGRYGVPPHPIAGLAYDGIAAVGALLRQGKDLSAASLTQSAGFAGVSGIFRLRSDRTNERALAIAEVRDHRAAIIDNAPRRFPGAGL